uniref:Uncharacterized protein n=1 Tax=Steinernema glaseri TaxID=37863 RepID=A0A1I7Y731_9BILA
MPPPAYSFPLRQRFTALTCTAGTIEASVWTLCLRITLPSLFFTFSSHQEPFAALNVIPPLANGKSKALDYNIPYTHERPGARSQLIGFLFSATRKTKATRDQEEIVGVLLLSGYEAYAMVLEAYASCMTIKSKERTIEPRCFPTRASITPSGS